MISDLGYWKPDSPAFTTHEFQTTDMSQPREHPLPIRCPVSAFRNRRGGTFLTVLAVLGCFAVFLIVLWFAYLPQRRATAPVELTGVPAEEQWRYTAEGRKARLVELRAKEHAAATSYAWIDRGQGVVQLPLDRAMELTVRELNARRK